MVPDRAYTQGHVEEEGKGSETEGGYRATCGDTCIARQGAQKDTQKKEHGKILLPGYPDIGFCNLEEAAAFGNFTKETVPPDQPGDGVGNDHREGNGVSW